MDQLLAMKDTYCMCPSNIETLIGQTGRKDSASTSDSVPQHKVSALKRSKKPALTRKRRHVLPDITESLRETLQTLLSNPDINIKPRSKGRKGLHSGLSKRRSLYIGVCSNGSHWQALINVGPNKRYIGTYLSEKEAGIMYDLYSIGLHGLKASTNFAYEAPFLAEMLQEYLENNEIDTVKFACRV